MRIGLIDVDGHNYPNLALMRLSSYHKSKGDLVEWWWSDLVHYDIVYMSKVFSAKYSPDVPEPLNADLVIKGGTGYAIEEADGREIYHKELDPDLMPEIERCFPDYNLYPDLVRDTAYGHLTRGCPRACPFCLVSKKEGRKSCQVAELGDFHIGQKNIKLMDPNILACRNRDRLIDNLIDSRAYIDFTQGLDIRMTDKDVADQLGRMRVKRIHFAWDNPREDLTDYFRRFTGWYKRKDRRVKAAYVLTNFDSTHEEDLWRIYTLRGLGYDPYVMIYDKPNAPDETRKLQRWCNNRKIFNEVPDFKNFYPKKG